jgi:hypothetical protein
MVLPIPNPTILWELQGIRSAGLRKRVRRRVPFSASPVYCMTQCKNIPRYLELSETGDMRTRGQGLGFVLRMD